MGDHKRRQKARRRHAYIYRVDGPRGPIFFATEDRARAAVVAFALTDRIVNMRKMLTRGRVHVSSDGRVLAV